jgi:prepilin-type processing-associated H-X9-DG protein
MKTKTSFSKKDFFVVLGCVVFLLGNLAVTGSNGRARAKEMVCRANLQKWGAIFGMYTADNDGYFQAGWTIVCKPGDRWFDLLRPYFGDNNDILFCPTATRTQRDGYGNRTGATGTFSAWGRFMSPGGILYCTLQGSAGSYGNNMWACNPTAVTGHDEAGFWRTTAVKGGGDIPLLADSMATGGWPNAWDEPPLYDGDYASMGHISPMKAFCIDRHNAAINMLFLDFSVRKVGLKELWELTWHRLWREQYEQAGGPPRVWNDPDHWMYNMKDFPIE